jgi:hypothetical protein
MSSVDIFERWIRGYRESLRRDPSIPCVIGDFIRLLVEARSLMPFTSETFEWEKVASKLLLDEAIDWGQEMSYADDAGLRLAPEQQARLDEMSRGGEQVSP